ncbi:MAG: hypothetical protein ACYTFG_18185 [Planctomycetota bacterium]|jgi:hypothetical protein
MKQAIVTRFYGPTDSNGARVIAKARAGRKRSKYDYNLDTFENHRAAAVALCERFGWPKELAGGAMPDGTGYCFLMLEAP